MPHDPAFRYAEHKKIKSFYDKDVFYYQGTEFIDRVEQLLVEQMRQYLGCTEVETRAISGQMSNMATFLRPHGLEEPAGPEARP